MAFKGGSLVSNILQKSSTLDQKVIETSAQKLSKMAGQLKEQVYEHVRQRYVEFQSYVQSTEDVEEQLREVDNEYRRLETKIGGELKEKIVESADKRREIEGQLREVQEKIDFVQRLVSIHEGLQASKQSLGEDNFTAAVGKLQKVTEDLKGLAEVGCEAKVFTTLQEETAVLSSEADLSLVEEWNKYVSWSPESAPMNPSYSTTLKTKLTVPAASVDNGGFMDTVSACKVLDTWARMRSVFAKKLLHLAVKPLIVNPTLEVRREVEPGKDSVVLRFVEVKKPTGMERFSQLYTNLGTIFKLVWQVLPQDEEWMREIGQRVCPEMTRLVIECCLTTTVPKTSEELEQYEKVKSLTGEFEAGLIKLGMVEAKFCELSNFTQNIEVHFADQKRRDLLANTRSILMKSIHNTETVTPSKNVVDLLPSLASSHDDHTPEEKAIAELRLIRPEDELKDIGVKFPVCTISKSVKEFVEVLDETLRDCYSRETDTEKLDVFRVARDMVDLFRAVFPTHHESDIATIPMAAAVYYNNCMYVTHYLIVTGAKIRENLGANLPQCTFVDLVPFVRRMGEDTFQLEMKKQRESVLRSLKTFGNFMGVSGDDKRDEVYRGIRQGLFQLTQLSRVYKEALPAHVHKDSVGSLLDVLVSYVVKGILALEDIVSNDAAELHQILDTILEKGASVMQFSEEQMKDLPLHCASWVQLQQLAFVLDARLYEIVDRWDGGKGTLAQHFKPVEVRNLIKALFTNTDRRAAALSKITL
jgi:centromere/kinetochore protein ZW10